MIANIRSAKHIFSANLKRHITLIEGDSGTGKTLFTEFMRNQSLLNPNKIHVVQGVSELNTFLSTCEQDSIVVFDKVEQCNDLRSKCEIIYKYILAGSQKDVYFIIMQRGNLPIVTTVDMYAEMTCTKKGELIYFGINYKYGGD